MNDCCPCCGEKRLVINKADMIAYCVVCGETCELVNEKWRVLLELD